MNLTHVIKSVWEFTYSHISSIFVIFLEKLRLGKQNEMKMKRGGSRGRREPSRAGSRRVGNGATVGMRRN